MTVDPGTALALVVAVAAYVVGWRRRPPPATAGRAWCFAGGVVVIVIALLSPLERLAEELFAAHMVQHLLVGLVAPLLFVAAAPIRVAGAAIDPGTQRVLHRWVRPVPLRRASAGTGLLAVAVHAVVLWAWHAPALYEAAVDVPLVHAAEHASLFAGGLALWAVVLPARSGARSGVPLLWLFVTGLQSGALAALLTLAPRPLYDVHAAAVAEWGTTLLHDQQLAGAVMWVLGGLVHGVAAIVLLVRWLQAPPRSAPPLRSAVVRS